MQSFHHFVCLSGLPRTGTTLLSAILSQNPTIHAEGNSPVCQLMWEMCKSVTNCKEQLRANNKEYLVFDLISQIPHIYYKNITEQIVVDKCRSWTVDTNYQLAKHCINQNLKVIVMVRPIIDIITSFAKLYIKNGITGETLENYLLQLLEPGGEPVMRSLDGVKNAMKQNNESTFLFVRYDDLINNPKHTIERIYSFCGWKSFEHNFDNIQMKYPENDEVYGLKGFHEIRKTIQKDIVKPEKILSKKVIEICKNNELVCTNYL